MHEPAPVIVVDLMEDERARLLQLLGQLTEQAWSLPTACPGWSVKDVAVHLLGGDIGILSRKRDHFHEPPSAPIASLADLVAHVDRANARWVEAGRRISPRLLVELLAFTGEATYRYFAVRDPTELSERVSWAGPEPAPAWLDTAREYTERWVHQQHIRDAVGRPGLKDRRFLGPVLETFTRALPPTFREVFADPGTVVTLTISGNAGGRWSLVHRYDRWALMVGAPAHAAASVTLDQETAWRLFTKGISREEARTRATLAGDAQLGGTFLEAVAIIG